MKIDNINDFERLERPRVQEIPGFYGKKLIDGVVIKKLPMFSDERGFLCEFIRLNDEELKASNIKQMIA